MRKTTFSNLKLVEYCTNFERSAIRLYQIFWREDLKISELVYKSLNPFDSIVKHKLFLL